MSLPNPSNPGVQRVRAAVVDGRSRNVGYRQKQLEALHNGLLSKSSALCSAATKDNGGAGISVEVEAEFCMTMDAVRHLYEGLDFEGDLKKEYSVTAGKDNTTRRAGVGLVVIRPTNHTRLYSILSSISAAIAAGNCVILELQSNLLEVDTVLRELLPKVLDQDTFFISTTKIESKESRLHTLVDQESKDASVAPNKDVLSNSTARVIAVVDRSADVDAAARAIVHARFGFQGTSPYAPDLIVVNEFVKKRFVEACVQYSSRQFAAENGTPGAAPRNVEQDIRKSIQVAESKGHLSTFGSSQFMLVDISNRDTALANMKITGRYLAITSCTSMSDATISQRAEVPFLAGYFFGTPEAGNFLSQNINCHVAFINQIPLHLLLGPAAPISHAPSIPYRYSTDMFSVPQPQFIEPPTPSVVQIATLLAESDRAATRQLQSLSLTPLKVRKQPLGKAIGFFEQGILLGLSISLSVALPVIGYGGYITGQKAWELARRRS